MIRVQGAQPCQDEQLVGVNPKTNYFIAELAAKRGVCKNNDDYFQQLPTPSNFDLTEYEF